MRKLLFLLAFVAFASLVSASFLDIAEPVAKRIDEGGSVFIGTAGPGQTVVISGQRATVRNDGEARPLGWDSIVGVSYPLGWEVEDSPLYESPMKLKIKIAPDAEEGEYSLALAAIDENNYDELGSVRFNVTVNVSKDVFDISISPSKREVGVGQPAVYYVTIKNKGVASDPFEITSSGLPAWRFKKSSVVNSDSTKVIGYEAVLNEEGEKTFKIIVTSLSSDQIRKEMDVTIKTKNSLLADYKATSHGLLVFPVIEQVIYSLIGLLSNFV